ncbi:putative oxidoreductase [Paraburkholderia graminis C4D1M]|jgi:short-subunit dehydrogenase involved in D-alanine esterification of teichoic acids|uniref:Short-chain dehydrogenase/reductase SDR n=1 Tax=Paraburkholderia graminis (strain ATCC 700544 / DSM 17151 / LMG 18924 / NCIMB 13744 / C4D1M) TaxID=396598 RepID=B1G6U6_PARG4|nr:SDR family NAD(P)-dependent oxidoreductase [Paraburkholderia graminis]ALE59104.1 DltE [Burkholderia sp. HB1]EDT08166.1 short-chain dehydrogenase/reductase SDR [Paraburkholderia graminis C4D1M]CAB3709372.1 putative oxidoreductase [Paraburkholderia graminis C4D1M]
MKTSGNTILITGSTSGIGLGLAVRFNEAGNRVIVAGRRKALLEQITTDYPGVEAIELDVADAGSIVQASELAAERYPDLNVVINNAGIMLSENVLEPDSLKRAEESVAINLLGTIRMTYAFLPQLVRKNDGIIINVSSALAFVPFPIAMTYSATKAAVHVFTEGLRVQLAGSPVRVIELVPPGVRTTLFGQESDEQAMPLEDFLDETLALLHAEPTPKEIIVERAKFLRTAQATGNYANALEMLSAWKASD